MLKEIGRFIQSAIGFIFILSAVTKALSIDSFSLTVDMFCGLLEIDRLYGYGLLGATCVILFELFIGICAFIRPLRKIVLLIYPIVLLFFTYITYINYSDPYGGIETCSCFGSFFQFSPSIAFIKNIILLGFSLIAATLYYIQTDIQNV